MPNMGDLGVLAWVTALTVPALNQLVPAAMVLHGRMGAAKASRRWAPSERAAAACLFIVGLGALAICLYGAAGKSANANVRGPQVIGCKGWEIYHSNGTEFRGWG